MQGSNALLYYHSVSVDKCFTDRMTNTDTILPISLRFPSVMLLSEACRVDNTVNVVS